MNRMDSNYFIVLGRHLVRSQYAAAALADRQRGGRSARYIFNIGMRIRDRSACAYNH